MIKYPSKFNKWTLESQEEWLTKKLQELHKEEDNLRRILYQVRGGLRYEPRIEDRPDLEYVKPEDYGR